MGNTLTVRETAVLLDTDLSYTYHLIQLAACWRSASESIAFSAMPR